MRNTHDVFHMAIPTRDLDEALQFYCLGLGCKLARRRDDRVTFDFFGDQLVCHLSPEHVPQEPQMYPRHFGIGFHERASFENVYRLAKTRHLRFLHDHTKRFEGTAEEHVLFALVDPSNNVIEFKHYNDSRMLY